MTVLQALVQQNSILLLSACSAQTLDCTAPLRTCLLFFSASHIHSMMSLTLPRLCRRFGGKWCICFCEKCTFGSEFSGVGRRRIGSISLTSSAHRSWLIV